MLPGSDPLARFITVLAAALNEILFVNRLLVAADADTTSGERQYLLRTAISHLWELSLALAEWHNHEAVRPLIGALSQQARADLEAVLRVASPGDDPVLKTMVHLRNRAIWHYAGPTDQKWIEKALDAAADDQGTFGFGATMGSIRAGFADKILLRFSVQLFPGDEEAELAAFSQWQHSGAALRHVGHGCILWDSSGSRWGPSGRRTRLGLGSAAHEAGRH